MSLAATLYSSIENCQLFSRQLLKESSGFILIEAPLLHKFIASMKFQIEIVEMACRSNIGQECQVIQPFIILRH